MNVLIDIGHPAHVHLFKYLAKNLQEHGHTLYFSVRDIPVAKHLMEVYGMPYIDLGGKKDSILGKAWVVLRQDWQLLKFVWKKKIRWGIGCGIVIPHLSVLSRMTSFKFDDDDDAVEPLMVKFGHPFSDVVMTPAVIKRKTKHAVYYKGTKELAYLHPSRFTPDSSVLTKLGLKEGERFFIMRFVAFKGFHDQGEYGLTPERKIKLLNRLLQYGKVFITSERAVEPELEPYRVSVPAEDMHSLLSFASMFVGDSQTMTSEAGLLGVPAFKCNTFAGRLSVPNMYEEYGLCRCFTPDRFDEMYAEIETMLAGEDPKAEWVERRRRFLADMINPTAFFTWFIENYPESRKMMKNNPDYQRNFK